MKETAFEMPVVTLHLPNGPHSQDAVVLVDGHDVTHLTNHVDVSVGMDGVPTVRLKLNAHRGLDVVLPAAVVLQVHPPEGCTLVVENLGGVKRYRVVTSEEE